MRLCVSFWSLLSWDTQVGVFTLILEICIQWTWECNWIWKEGLPVAPSIPLIGVSGICEKNVPSWLILNSFGNLQNLIKQAHFEKKKEKNSSSCELTVTGRKWITVLANVFRESTFQSASLLSFEIASPWNRSIYRGENLSLTNPLSVNCRQGLQFCLWDGQSVCVWKASSCL